MSSELEVYKQRLSDYRSKQDACYLYRDLHSSSTSKVRSGLYFNVSPLTEWQAHEPVPNTNIHVQVRTELIRT